MDSCLVDSDSQGARLIRHRRGNPETETGLSLNDRGCERTGRRPEPKRQGGPKVLGESDQPIVLRERESRSHGEGADGNP